MSDQLSCQNCGGAMMLRPTGSPNGYPSASCPDCGTVVMFRTKKAAEAIRARFFAAAGTSPTASDPTPSVETSSRDEAPAAPSARKDWFDDL